MSMLAKKVNGKNQKNGQTHDFGDWFDKHKREYYIVLGLVIFTLIKWSGFDKLVVNVMLAFIPLLFGIAIAFILTPIIDFFHNRGIKRGLAKLITLSSAVVIGGVLAGIMIPYLVTEFSFFFNGMLGDRHQAEWIEKFLKFINDNKILLELDFAAYGSVDEWIENLENVLINIGNTYAEYEYSAASGLVSTADNTVVHIPSIPDAFRNATTGLLKVDGVGALYRLIFIGSDSLGMRETGLIYGAVETVFRLTDFAQYGDLVVKTASLVLDWLFKMLMSVVIAFFLLDNYKGLMHWVTHHAISDEKNDREAVAGAIHDSIAGWLKGIAVDFLIMFTMTSVALYIAGSTSGIGGEVFVKAAFMYGLLMAIANLIPLIGPFIGMIPIILAGLLILAETGNALPLIFAIIAASIIQMIESNILIPIIFGKSTSLHPITILIGISVLGAVFGFVGMFFTIPLIATFKNVMIVKNYDVRI